MYGADYDALLLALYALLLNYLVSLDNRRGASAVPMHARQLTAGTHPVLPPCAVPCCVQVRPAVDLMLDLSKGLQG